VPPWFTAQSAQASPRLAVRSDASRRLIRRRPEFLARASKDQVFERKSGSDRRKIFSAAVGLAEKPKNSGTNDNWKTALFLFRRIRGTVFAHQQRHTAASHGLFFTSEWPLS
jgi:hypothetical protein